MPGFFGGMVRENTQETTHQLKQISAAGRKCVVFAAFLHSSCDFGWESRKLEAVFPPPHPQKPLSHWGRGGALSYLEIPPVKLHQNPPKPPVAVA